MKYTAKQKEHLILNNKTGFRRGVKIKLEPNQELFMVQYLSVRKFYGYDLIPILPKAKKIEYEILESSMNIPETFEEFKKRTYGNQNNRS